MCVGWRWHGGTGPSTDTTAPTHPSCACTRCDIHYSNYITQIGTTYGMGWDDQTMMCCKYDGFRTLDLNAVCSSLVHLASRAAASHVLSVYVIAWRAAL
jgi:hypothetical protein